jgi:hypothetical protein
MKFYRFVAVCLAMLLLLTACAAPALPTVDPNGPPMLVVSSVDGKQMFGRDDMENLPVVNETLNGVTYKGATAAALLHAAGVDPEALKGVRAVYADGTTLELDVTSLLGGEGLIAYARADGDLTPEDGAFRLVLPKADAAHNLPGLTELQLTLSEE